jgi:riboflavin transporter FmnP
VQDPVPGDPTSKLKSAALGFVIGTGVSLACAGIAFSVIAIPLYALASAEPGSGLNRDLIRKGLFNVALPFGLIAGVAIGCIVAVWYARGGRLPQDRTPLHEEAEGRL